MDCTYDLLLIIAAEFIQLFEMLQIYVHCILFLVRYLYDTL